MDDKSTLITRFPNDTLGRAFADFLRWPVVPFLGLTQDYPMRLEEFADDGHLVVRAELPGVDPDKDIHITMAEGLLTISGERRSEMKTEKKGSHFSEMQYGSFSRTIPLPDGASEKDVVASYRDGILEVRLPLTKPAVPAATVIPVAH
ncbi:MAG TPA: Hsp20/alpha crystallin family protein [Candidatus Acidoferrales bacterium]|nr:Hsp20/alpha crystallin family protein [Candidatus Acidoferrales bacterium]